jgi:hypothetical protein
VLYCSDRPRKSIVGIGNAMVRVDRFEQEELVLLESVIKSVELVYRRKLMQS